MILRRRFLKIFASLSALSLVPTSQTKYVSPKNMDCIYEFEKDRQSHISDKKKIQIENLNQEFIRNKKLLSITRSIVPHNESKINITCIFDSTLSKALYIKLKFDIIKLQEQQIS